jgi:hypothetical protein
MGEPVIGGKPADKRHWLCCSIRKAEAMYEAANRSARPGTAREARASGATILADRNSQTRTYIVWHNCRYAEMWHRCLCSGEIAGSQPLAVQGPRIAKMTKDKMIEWFKSAPMSSRHQRMLWAAQNIARLTGATEGGAYQMLLLALIEAEGRLDLAEFNDLQMSGT